MGSRKTFIEQGLEQGGINSSDFYKIVGQDQLNTAQASSLGVPLGPITGCGVGLADNTGLLDQLFCDC